MHDYQHIQITVRYVQDAVMAYMLALRQSSANRRQSQTAEDDDDPDQEILRIDTPNQVPH